MASTSLGAAPKFFNPAAKIAFPKSVVFKDALAGGGKFPKVFTPSAGLTRRSRQTGVQKQEKMPSQAGARSRSTGKQRLVY